MKQKFVSSWIDNMGTGIMMLDGTYDAATKAFTYAGEYEMMPGMKEKVREVFKVTDKGMTMEYYEDRGQGEAGRKQIASLRDPRYGLYAQRVKGKRKRSDRSRHYDRLIREFSLVS